MPYSGPDDPSLPERIKKLGRAIRNRWQGAFNGALKQYGDEGRAMATANAAIKEDGELEESDHWALVEGELIEREFSAERRDELAKSGAAMSGGGFPIATVGDLRNAIHAIGRAGNRSATIAHIRKRARALGHTDMLPDTWGEEVEEGTEEPVTWLSGLSEPIEVLAEQEGGTVEVTIIKAGWSENGRYYSPSVLTKALPMFEGAQAFADHPTKTEQRERFNRSVKDLVGVFEGIYQDAKGNVKGKLRLIGKMGEEMRPYIAEAVKGVVNVGLSINAGGSVRNGIAEGRRGLVVEELTSVQSVDVVINPAAGGRFERLVASDWLADLLKEISFEDWKQHHPEHEEVHMPELKEQIEEAVSAAVRAAVEPLQEQIASAQRRDSARSKIAASLLPKSIHNDVLEALEGLTEEAQDKEIARQLEMVKKLAPKAVVTGAGQGGSSSETPLAEEVGSKVLGINVPYAKPEETVWEYRERTRRQTA